MGTVKGDPSRPVPPDAIPQTGLATSGYAQATSAVASGYSAAINSGATTSAQPASSQATAAAPSNIASVVPGGGAVLIGESSSPSVVYSSPSTSPGVSAVPSSIPADSSSPTTAVATVVVPANSGTAEEMSGGSSVVVPAPAPTQVTTTPEACGRGGRKGPHRSAM
jgi:hypothetical protein